MKDRYLPSLSVTTYDFSSVIFMPSMLSLSKNALALACSSIKYCAIFWLAAALPATETAGYCIVSVLPLDFVYTAFCASCTVAGAAAKDNEPTSKAAHSAAANFSFIIPTSCVLCMLYYTIVQKANAIVFQG